MIVRIGHGLFDALQETSIDSECEVCCALFGSRSDDAVVIDDLEFIQNPHTTANTFGIPFEEYSRLTDEGMIGIFHSHRGDPRPSYLDEVFIRKSGLLWLIGGTTKGRFTVHAYSFGRRLVEHSLVQT